MIKVEGVERVVVTMVGGVATVCLVGTEGGARLVEVPMSQGVGVAEWV